MSDLKDLGRNADQIIWRAWDGDYYADSIHVTHEGAIGISCGGTVHVMPVKDWHKLATLRAALTPPADDEVEAIRARAKEGNGYFQWGSDASIAAQNDRATLLRALAAERARRVEVEAKLAKRLEPDMFWDTDDAERPYDSVEEILWETDAEGEGIIEVKAAVRCPDAAYVYRFTNDPETDDREVGIEMMSDDDYKHYRAAMSIAAGARMMWQEMVDIEAAKLFEANPAPLPAWMHGKPWRSIDWSYRKHHRRLAHEQLAATITKETP